MLPIFLRLRLLTIPLKENLSAADKHDEKRCCFEFQSLFSKLQKATINFVMSVRPSLPQSFYVCVCMSICLSVRPYDTTQLLVDWFMLKLIFQYILKICPENSSFIKIGQNNGYFTWRPICIVFIISRAFILRMRNFSDQSCRENQNTHLVNKNIFLFRNSCLFKR